MPQRLTADQRNLIKRYLLWCYKTTKEELDRTDRKFTQLQADHFILDFLMKSQRRKGSGKRARDHQAFINDFKRYIETKNKEAYQGIRHSRHGYEQQRLRAVETAIQSFLSAKDLKEIKSLYQAEMTRRILEAREH